MTLLSSITSRLPQWTRGPRPVPPPAPAPETHFLTPAATAPVAVVGELEDFEGFLPSLGYRTRLVRLPDNRTRVDVAAGTIRVGILVFTRSGDLETVKLWQRIPTIGIDVASAELLIHDGDRITLNSGYPDLHVRTRDALTALSLTLEGIAA